MPAPLPDIHRLLCEHLTSANPCSLVTVLHSTGSTPRKTGTKALFTPDGLLHGTIGGGLLESTARQRALEALRTRQPALFDFRFAGAHAHEDKPVCGGLMRILIDPVRPDHLPAYAAAAHAHEHRHRGLLLTHIEPGPPLRTTVQWLPADSIASAQASAPPDLLTRALREESAHYHRDPATQSELLIEPIVPRPLLLIVGGGHVGQALARHAALAGFTLAVIDDRPEFADPALFPDGVITRTGDIAQALSEFPIDSDTFIALVSRGHLTDARALAAVIDKPAGYIGMMGSRRKIALLRADFLTSGRCTPDQFDRVHAPIGLDIGAATVPEIAASIVAQLISVWRTRSATAGGWI